MHMCKKNKSGALQNYHLLILQQKFIVIKKREIFFLATLLFSTWHVVKWRWDNPEMNDETIKIVRVSVSIEDESVDDEYTHF